MNGVTRAIVRQIEDLGYAVSIQQLRRALNITGALDHFAEPYVEAHAVRLANPDEQHVARVFGDHDEPTIYRAVCELAQSVGIDLAA